MRDPSSVPPEVTGTGAPNPWTAELPPAINLYVGDGTEITLPSAAGSGNKWSVERVAGEDVAEVELRRGEAPVLEGNPPPTYGVPEILTVRAVRPGRGTWRLRLARPWTPDEPVAEHDIEVAVT
jgi:Chagasin family peptidase inhibitor I42